MAETFSTPFGDIDPAAVEAATAAAAQADSRRNMEEITIKFAKGLCSDPFTSKEGKEFVRSRTAIRPTMIRGRSLFWKANRSMRTSTAKAFGRRSRQMATPRCQGPFLPDRMRTAGTSGIQRNGRFRTGSSRKWSSSTRIAAGMRGLPHRRVERHRSKKPSLKIKRRQTGRTGRRPKHRKSRKRNRNAERSVNMAETEAFRSFFFSAQNM